MEDAKIRSLNAYQDKSGLIRLKTFVSNRQDRFGFRHPVILDPKHPLVIKLIQHIHEELKHARTRIVMDSLREHVWILCSRRVIRSVLFGCVVRKRYNARRIETPPSILPKECVRDAAVFEVTGIDMAVPLFLKNGQKAWTCLFTCAMYRAIHFELIKSLLTEGFLEVLKCFVAHRRRPSIIFSDNGTNFTGASNLFRSLNWKKIDEYATVKKMVWRFNPPSAAWWGGWWERQIRTVKEILRKVLGRARLNAEKLYTTLCECKAIINSRPITYVSDDAAQLAPLTPAMFIQDIQEVGVPDLDHIDENKLKARFRYRQELRVCLRKRFCSE